MRLLILGRTEILYETAKLLSENHVIAGIITSSASPESAKGENDFRKLAEDIGCPFLYTVKLGKDAVKFIKDIKPDIGVSMNWVSIVGKDILDIVPMGILNAHFADLPGFRGNAVVNWAILSGEEKIPLTIHYMDADELDSGGIVIQEFIDINDDTSIKDVYDSAASKVPYLFDKALKLIGDNNVHLIKQNETGKRSFRCYPRVPSDSRIDWNESAVRIHKLIKASAAPYSGAYTFMKENDGSIKKVYIWDSRVIMPETDDMCVPGHIIKNDKVTGESWVFTGKGVLAISSISFDDGENIQPGKYWKSIRLKFGFDAEEELINIKKQINSIITKITK